MRSRLLLAVMSAMVALSANAQPGGALINRTDAEGRKQGSWSKQWHNGLLRYTGQFVDDLPTGTFQHYDADGKLTTTQVYAADGIVSRVKHFYPSAALMAVGKYVGQTKDSTWNYYSELGHLNRVEHFRKGELIGEQVTYYPNGAVAERSNWENGKQNGAYMSWFPDGTLKSEATYSDGEPNGRMLFYHPNGTKEIEGSATNGVRNGTWFYYNTDGSLQLQAVYKRGIIVKERKENGEFNDHYDNEQLRSTVNYKAGKREGPFTEYFDNGKWELREVAADPIKGVPADMERLLVGQTKSREGTYKNDLLEGEVKEYDQKGKLLKTTQYKAGVEQ